uniref:Hydrogenase-4 component C n=1 Tax=uncultured bacterium Contigcl_1738 TaxID=1393655 RepID=W0FRA7_9BACT|nr:hydrogenase-4 component C [uncultured bacterium Contigcl_1738]
MNIIKGQHLTGERALFKARGLRVENCRFDEGESPLKESRDIEVTNTVFGWRYPLWYDEHVSVKGSAFIETARAGIWYSNDVELIDCSFDAPKGIRKCHNVRLSHVQMPHADETLWWCEDVRVEDVSVTGDYFLQGSRDIYVKNLHLSGKYSFDGCTNLVVEDSRLITKDAFWNCENVVVRNCFIVSEYLAWNARNVTFENCIIQSLQGLCYVSGLTLRSCDLMDTDLAFEYCSDVDAELRTPVVSVKNPLNGRIVAPSIGEIIFDDPEVNPCNTAILQTERREPFVCLCRAV